MPEDEKAVIIATPTFHHVQIQPVRKANITDSGIHLAAVTKKSNDERRTQEAYVLAVGPGIRNTEGKYRDVPTVRVGDRIAVARLGVVKCKIVEGELYFIEANNIVAVLPKNDKPTSPER